MYWHCARRCCLVPQWLYSSRITRSDFIQMVGRILADAHIRQVLKEQEERYTVHDGEKFKLKCSSYLALSCTMTGDWEIGFNI